MNWFYIVYAYHSTVWKSLFLLHSDCTYLTRTKILPMLGTGYFLKINSQQKNQCVLVSWMQHGRSSRHSFKQKQGLLNSFNPHSTMARTHTTRNHDFLESISFSFKSDLSASSLLLFMLLIYAYRSTVWKSLFLLHPDCTYLTRTKILSMLGTGYFLKINSQQEKPRCPSVVNAERPFFKISQF